MRMALLHTHPRIKPKQAGAPWQHARLHCMRTWLYRPTRYAACMHAQEAARLRQEVTAERQLRTRAHLALIGAEATIKRLRAAAAGAAAAAARPMTPAASPLQSPNSTQCTVSPAGLPAGFRPYKAAACTGLEPPGCMSPKELPPDTPASRVRSAFRPLALQPAGNLGAEGVAGAGGRAVQGAAPAATSHAGDAGDAAAGADQLQLLLRGLFVRMDGAAGTAQPEGGDEGQEVQQWLTQLAQHAVGPSTPPGDVGRLVQALLLTARKSLPADSPLQGKLARMLNGDASPRPQGLDGPVAFRGFASPSASSTQRQQQEQAPSCRIAGDGSAAATSRAPGGCAAAAAGGAGALAHAVEEMLASRAPVDAAREASSLSTSRQQQATTLNSTAAASPAAHQSTPGRQLPACLQHPSSTSSSSGAASLPTSSCGSDMFAMTLRERHLRYQALAAAGQSPAASGAGHSQQHPSCRPQAGLQPGAPAVGAAGPPSPRLSGTGGLSLEALPAASPMTALVLIESWTQAAYLAAKQALLDAAQPPGPSDEELEEEEEALAAAASSTADAPAAYAGLLQPWGEAAGTDVEPWVVAALAASARRTCGGSGASSQTEPAWVLSGSQSSDAPSAASQPAAAAPAAARSASVSVQTSDSPPAAHQRNNMGASSCGRGPLYPKPSPRPVRATVSVHQPQNITVCTSLPCPCFALLTRSPERAAACTLVLQQACPLARSISRWRVRQAALSLQSLPPPPHPGRSRSCQTPCRRPAATRTPRSARPGQQARASAARAGAGRAARRGACRRARRRQSC